VRPGEALRRRGEDSASTALSLEPGLLLDPAQGKTRLAPSVGFDLPEQRLACLDGAQRGNPLKLVSLLGLPFLQHAGASVEITLAGIERDTTALQLVELSIQRLQPVQHQIGLRTVAA